MKNERIISFVIGFIIGIIPGFFGIYFFHLTWWMIVIPTIFVLIYLQEKYDFEKKLMNKINKIIK